MSANLVYPGSKATLKKDKDRHLLLRKFEWPDSKKALSFLFGLQVRLGLIKAHSKVILASFLA